MNARKSGQVRRSARAPSTNQPRRDAAREARETISQHIKDEKAKVLKSTSAAVTVDTITQENMNKKQKPPKTEKRDSSAGRSGDGKSKNLKKRKDKRSSEILSPETKRAREDHGWIGNGESIKRSILKPVNIGFVSIEFLLNIFSGRKWLR